MVPLGSDPRQWFFWVQTLGNGSSGFRPSAIVLLGPDPRRWFVQVQTLGNGSCGSTLGRSVLPPRPEPCCRNEKGCTELCAVWIREGHRSFFQHRKENISCSNLDRMWLKKFWSSVVQDVLWTVRQIVDHTLWQCDKVDTIVPTSSSLSCPPKCHNGNRGLHFFLKQRHRCCPCLKKATDPLTILPQPGLCKMPPETWLGS